MTLKLPPLNRSEEERALEYAQIRMEGGLEEEVLEVGKSLNALREAQSASKALWMTQSVPTPEDIEEALKREYRTLSELGDKQLDLAKALSKETVRRWNQNG